MTAKPKEKKCENCEGSGKITTEATQPVGGWDPNYGSDPNSTYQDTEPCTKCNGTGKG